MMRVRVAETGEDFVRETLSVFIGDVSDGGVTQWFAADNTVKFFPADGPRTEEPRPSLILRADHARALLSELQRHFQGGDDLRALRKDYDAERARVDRLIGALIQPGGAA